jgi:hypothetical protein
MKVWQRKGPTHLESDCGRFTIARITLGERVIYELWNVPRRQRIDAYATPEEAKAAAELEDVF